MTLGLSAVALMVSPTKWTQHFGALTGLGTAALTLGLVVFGRRALAAVRDAETARRRRVAGLAAVTVVCGLVLAGQNMWPFVSGWYTPTFSTVPPLVGTVPIATIVLVLGGAVVVPLLVWSVWRRSARPRRTTPATATRTRACVPAPAAPVAVVLVAVLALQVLGLARVAVAHADGYTPASDVLATLRGDPCGLQSALQVETDPAAGVLPVAPPPAPVPGIVPAPAVPPATPADVDAGGTALPGVAVAGTGSTSWYTLDPRQRDGVLPVVVTLTGLLRPGDVLERRVRLRRRGAGDGPADRSGARRRRCPHGPPAARPARGRRRPAERRRGPRRRRRGVPPPRTPCSPR